MSNGFINKAVYTILFPIYNIIHYAVLKVSCDHTVEIHYIGLFDIHAVHFVFTI